MIKIDIATKIASDVDITKKDALVITDTIIDSVKNILVKHKKIEIRDFGIFKIKERKPRIGRNPKTKVEVSIPVRKSLTFKPGKELKDIINKKS